MGGLVVLSDRVIGLGGINGFVWDNIIRKFNREMDLNR